MTDFANDFWNSIEEFVRQQNLVVERPAGSHHPTFAEYVYPLDYGYIRESRGGDGEEIDVWIGSGQLRVTGVACTFDPIKRDSEVKVLWRVTDTELGLLEKFYRPQPQNALLIPRTNHYRS